MTRRRRRLIAILACGVGLGSAAGLTLAAMGTTMELFLTPNRIAAAPPPGRAFRLGGLVEAGSVLRTSEDGTPSTRFRITDGGTAAVMVVFSGILPDLFREGQGIVAAGTLRPDGVFEASEVLAKHDENYIPKDVADALRASGRWKPETGQKPPLSAFNGMPAAVSERAGG